MNNIPKQYQYIIAYMLVLVIASLGCYMLIIKPMISRSSVLEGGNNDLRKKLEKDNVPTTEELINSAIKAKKRELSGGSKKIDYNENSDALCGRFGVLPKSEFTVDYCTRYLGDKIRRQYNNSLSSINDLDFQTEFDFLLQKLKKDYIFIHPDVLGISKDSDSKAGLLLLKVWALDLFAKKIIENSLKIHKILDKRVNTDSGRGAASNIKIMPIKAYYLNEESKTPYLLEISVRANVDGSMKNIIKFLHAIQNKECFMPINHLEIRSFPEKVNSRRNREKKILQTKKTSALIECSVFYYFDDKESENFNTTKTKILPRGA